VLDAGCRTTQGENEGAAKVESDQQRIDNDLFVNDQLAYGESQA
jgi:hypothetical protein